MATPEALRSLQLIVDRSPEGVGVPIDTLQEEGVPAAIVRDLQVEGLIEFVGGDEDTVCVTGAGREVLRPTNSL
jgi:hypothetical protein